MARRTAAEVYAAARAGGLSAPQAVIAVAIAIAESSLNDSAIGDVSLETNVWGPSVGVYQIRTLKAQTGTGSDRDITALQGNLARQTQAMLNISKNGTNWSPWTTYTRGTYRQYMGQATSAATSAGATPVGLSVEPTGLVTDQIGQYVKPARDLMLKLAVVGLGLGVVGFGLWRAYGEQAKSTLGGAVDKMTSLPS